MSDTEEIQYPRKGKDPIRPEAPPPPRLKSGDLPPLDEDEAHGWDMHAGVPSGGGFMIEPEVPTDSLPGWIIAEPTLGISTLEPAELFDAAEVTLDDTISNRPLIASLDTICMLRKEYEHGNSIFLEQIDWLVQQGYTGVRRTRGDGDCFYRSVAFAYVERILNAPDEDLSVTQAISVIEPTTEMLERAGFQSIVFEDWIGTLIGVIKRVVDPDPSMRLTPVSLLHAFNDYETSNSVVMYLRLLTSATMRADPDQYAAFLINPETGESISLEDFCQNAVEAMGKEADHVQMTALSRALQINLDIAYLDGHKSGTSPVNFVYIKNVDDPESIKLLYRPGHYDILDSRASAEETTGIGLV